MKKLVSILLLIMTAATWAQGIPARNARVVELEEKLMQEASNYFSRRYPNEPFLVKVDITPLRRSTESVQSGELLPYLEYGNEESVDEWDDPTLPLSFLRNRIIKVTLEVSVPESFDDQRLTEIKQELPVFLKLLPSRDDIRVERKIKDAKAKIPEWVYYGAGAVFISILMLGLMMRWSVGNIKLGGESSVATQAPMSIPPVAPAQPSKMQSTSEVRGDLTFHDPIKTLEIIQVKLKQLSDSGTFPNLSDMILMGDFCNKQPEKLGALVYEFPQSWQKRIVAFGRDTDWLMALTSPGKIDQSCIDLLDKMSRSRDLLSGDRQLENLLIQIWRLGDKSVPFLKKIDAGHAFILLGFLPKSLSLRIAKKAFPGNWGRLLEGNKSNIILDAKLVNDYTKQALDLMPEYNHTMLEGFRKDKEILTYLDQVSIEDERDIYETLPQDSFILKVRPAFYQLFELNDTDFAAFIARYPLDKLALTVLNSNRSYSKQIIDVLDDKKKLVFSGHLRRLDQGWSSEEQAEWRNRLAADLAEGTKQAEKINYGPSKENIADDKADKKTA